MSGLRPCAAIMRPDAAIVGLCLLQLGRIRLLGCKTITIKPERSVICPPLSGNRASCPAALGRRRIHRPALEPAIVRRRATATRHGGTGSGGGMLRAEWAAEGESVMRLPPQSKHGPAPGKYPKFHFFRPAGHLECASPIPPPTFRLSLNASNPLTPQTIP